VNHFDVVVSLLPFSMQANVQQLMPHISSNCLTYRRQSKWFVRG